MRQVKNPIHPADVFDFIVGTSTGALISFGLVHGNTKKFWEKQASIARESPWRLMPPMFVTKFIKGGNSGPVKMRNCQGEDREGMTVDEIIDFYEEFTEKIFKWPDDTSYNGCLCCCNLWRKIWRVMFKLGTDINPDPYTQDNLREYLKGLFGEMTLEDCEDSQKRAKVGAAALRFQEDPRKPDKLKLFSTSPRGKDKIAKVADVLVASTCAPVYFDAPAIVNGERFVDGAMGANCPVQKAIEQVKKTKGGELSFALSFAPPTRGLGGKKLEQYAPQYKVLYWLKYFPHALANGLGIYEAARMTSKMSTFVRLQPETYMSKEFKLDETKVEDMETAMECERIVSNDYFEMTMVAAAGIVLETRRGAKQKKLCPDQMAILIKIIHVARRRGNLRIAKHYLRDIKSISQDKEQKRHLELTMDLLCRESCLDYVNDQEQLQGIQSYLNHQSNTCVDESFQCCLENQKCLIEKALLKYHLRDYEAAAKTYKKAIEGLWNLNSGESLDSQKKQRFFRRLWDILSFHRYKIRTCPPQNNVCKLIVRAYSGLAMTLRAISKETENFTFAIPTPIGQDFQQKDEDKPKAKLKLGMPKQFKSRSDWDRLLDINNITEAADMLQKSCLRTLSEMQFRLGDNWLIVDIFDDLGQACQASGCHEEAVAHFEACLDALKKMEGFDSRASTKTARIISNMGWSFMCLGDLDSAWSNLMDSWNLWLHLLIFDEVRKHIKRGSNRVSKRSLKQPCGSFKNVFLEKKLSILIRDHRKSIRDSVEDFFSIKLKSEELDGVVENVIEKSDTLRNPDFCQCLIRMGECQLKSELAKARVRKSSIHSWQDKLGSEIDYASKSETSTHIESNGDSERTSTSASSSSSSENSIERKSLNDTDQQIQIYEAIGDKNILMDNSEWMETLLCSQKNYGSCLIMAEMFESLANLDACQRRQHLEKAIRYYEETLPVDQLAPSPDIDKLSRVPEDRRRIEVCLERLAHCHILMGDQRQGQQYKIREAEKYFNDAKFSHDGARDDFVRAKSYFQGQMEMLSLSEKDYNQAKRDFERQRIKRKEVEEAKNDYDYAMEESKRAEDNVVQAQSIYNDSQIKLDRARDDFDEILRKVGSAKESFDKAQITIENCLRTKQKSLDIIGQKGQKDDHPPELITKFSLDGKRGTRHWNTILREICQVYINLGERLEGLQADYPGYNVLKNAAECYITALDLMTKEAFGIKKSRKYWRRHFKGGLTDNPFQFPDPKVITKKLRTADAFTYSRALNAGANNLHKREEYKTAAKMYLRSEEILKALEEKACKELRDFIEDEVPRCKRRRERDLRRSEKSERRTQVPAKVTVMLERVRWRAEDLWLEKHTRELKDWVGRIRAELKVASDGAGVAQAKIGRE